MRFKRWLLKKFCKKELDKIKAEYQEQVDSIIEDKEREVKSIKYKADSENVMLEEARFIFRNNEGDVVGMATNKNGEEVFIVRKCYNNDIDFLLYNGLNYRAVNRHPRIMARYNTIHENDKYIRIDDTITVDDNVGNGSILMPPFLDYCKKHTSASEIRGELSNVDSEHFDRSQHFYEKHGFEVSFNDDRTRGSILYKLK